MIINDFKEEGFPVSIHNPIICLLRSGKFVPVYNRFDLKSRIEFGTVVSIFGIWPGKRVTDCYPLDLKKYSQIPTPPLLHKDIDSAIKIVILIESGEFSRVIYRPGPLCDNKAAIESNDKKLYEYICQVGLKYKKKFT
jgi:hypothetical protein